LIKYVVEPYSGKNAITKVLVERETRKCVWVNGRRKFKRVGYLRYFDTYNDAHSFIFNAIREKLDFSEKLYFEDKSEMDSFLERFPEKVDDFENSPKVVSRTYNADNKLIGVCVLADEGELNISVSEFVKWQKTQLQNQQQ
jgi:hypothetical protein